MDQTPRRERRLAPHIMWVSLFLLAHPGTGWGTVGVEAFHLGDYVTAYRRVPTASTSQGDAQGPASAWWYVL